MKWIFGLLIIFTILVLDQKIQSYGFCYNKGRALTNYDVEKIAIQSFLGLKDEEFLPATLLDLKGSFPDFTIEEFKKKYPDCCLITSRDLFAQKNKWGAEYGGLVSSVQVLLSHEQYQEYFKRTEEVRNGYFVYSVSLKKCGEVINNSGGWISAKRKAKMMPYNKYIRENWK